MKMLIVEIADGTNTEFMEKVEVKHLCDLGSEVKDAIENFVKLNEGALIPPVSIRVEEKDACRQAKARCR
jgi:hypothetical protein